MSQICPYSEINASQTKDQSCVKGPLKNTHQKFNNILEKVSFPFTAQRKLLSKPVPTLTEVFGICTLK